MRDDEKDKPIFHCQNTLEAYCHGQVKNNIEYSEENGPDVRCGWIERQDLGYTITRRETMDKRMRVCSMRLQQALGPGMPTMKTGLPYDCVLYCYSHHRKKDFSLR